MKHLKKRFLSRFVFVAGLVLAPAIYASPLTTADLNSPGDNLLTLDRDTGLEFLDPSATKAVSYNDTLQTPFVTQQGFRFATSDEFRQLLTDAGFTNFSGNFNTTDEAAAENLLNNLLGETIPPGQPFTINPPGTRFDANISDGFYSFAQTPGTPSGLANVVGVDYQSAGLGQAAQNQARVIGSLNQVSRDASRPIVGGLLVRSASSATAVPEPSDLALMGLGLTLIVVVVGFRRRHGRRLNC